MSTVQNIKTTCAKIRYLEKIKGVSFIEGIEKYYSGSENDLYDYSMYHILFGELSMLVGIDALGEQDERK